MRKLPTIIVMLLMLMGVSLNAQDLVITAVYDGPLSGGLPKGVELNALNDIADLSVYGLGSANNGGGSDGEEFTFPADAVSQGDFIYISSEALKFNDWFGFDPDYTSGAMGINGDDALELFMNGSVIDIFGEIDTDGTGQPWEYLDGWAYRNDGTGPDGSTFAVGNFTYSGKNALDGETSNATAATPIPIGTYTAGAATAVSTPTISPAAGEYFAAVTVTMACTTDGASIYYTTDGSDPDDGDTEYTAGFEITTDTTIKAIAYKAGFTESAVATNIYTFPNITEVATIAELRTQTVDNTYYKLTGEVILTFQQSFRNQKFIQDATAAIKIDDVDGNITSTYALYDGITGITGQLSEYGDMLQFIPSEDPGAATSNGNTVTPQLITFDDLTADFEDYEAELVKVEGVSFTDAGGTFAIGTVYPIADGSKATYNFRTNFYDADYIDETIPSVPQDLVLFPESRNDGEFVVSRNAADMTATIFEPASQLSFTAINNGENVYENLGFSVNVLVLDANDDATVVENDTEITISLETGSGTLAGTLTGTIPAGSGFITMSDIIYDKIETGVVLKVNSGSLTEGLSTAFDVLEVDLIITEIMYNALPGGNDSLEFIELYNNGSSALNLKDFTITAGVSHTFEDIEIAAGAYMLIAKDSTAIQNVFGVAATEWISGELKNTGEEIEIQEPSGNIVVYVDYGISSPWPTRTTGTSIRFNDPDLDNNDGANWGLSNEFVTTIGDTDIFASPLEESIRGFLVFTEIMYKALEGNIDTLEYIELYNNGDSTVHLEDYHFTEGVEYTFEEVDIAPGSFILIAIDKSAIENVFGKEAFEWTTGALSNSGEELELSDAAGNVVAYADFGKSTPWPARETGKSIRFCDSNLDNNLGENWTISEEFLLTVGNQDIFGSPLEACGASSLIAKFEADNTQIGEGNEVNFTDLSIGNIDSWTWTFEGGTPETSTDTNPTITYTTAGTYDVTLLITNANGENTETKEDYITVVEEEILMANFEADITTIDEEGEVIFTDLSTGTPESWLWTFEGGTPETSTDTNPTVTYAIAGTFDVTLLVTDADGDDTETKEDYITVVEEEILMANFEADITTIDEEGEVIFTNLSTGSPESWLWTFEGGTPATSTDQNPSVTYSAEGVYDVTLYVENANGNDTEVKTEYITVNTTAVAPIADFVVNQDMIFVGQSVQFVDESANNPTAWDWTFEGGTPASSDQQNPSVVYNTAGTFDVSLSVSNAGGNDELLQTDYITVLPATVGNLVITEIMYNPPEAGDDSLEYIEIYNNSNESLNLFEYEFSDGVEYVFPDITIQSNEYLVIAKNATAIFNTFGLTVLEWTNGALSNSGELIKLISPLGVTVDSVQYDDAAPWPTEADGNGPSITICDPNTENSVGDNWHASVNYLADNTEGTAIYGSPTMAPAPVADFIADETSFAGSGQVEFTQMATCNAESFAWEFEGGTPATSPDANPSVSYTNAGDFSVTLTVSNATGSHTFTIDDYIHIGVGILEQTMNQIAIIPNPSNGYFKLQNPDGMMMEVEVYSILGKLILTSTSEDVIYDLDLLSEENGVYFVRIIIGKQVKTIKIIKH